jgi:hypothetical protein
MIDNGFSHRDGHEFMFAHQLLMLLIHGMDDSFQIPLLSRDVKLFPVFAQDCDRIVHGSNHMLSDHEMICYLSRFSDSWNDFIYLHESSMKMLPLYIFKVTEIIYIYHILVSICYLVTCYLLKTYPFRHFLDDLFYHGHEVGEKHVYIYVFHSGNR